MSVGEQPLSTLESVDSRITIEPGKRGGRPYIRGMRITVEDVLNLLAGDMTEQEILHDFPELEAEDFLAIYKFASLSSGDECK